MITEFTDVFPQDSTLIPPKVTPVITGVVNVFSENPPDKLPLMCDIQHAIEFDSEEVIYQVHKGDISHNCIMQTPSIHLPVVSIALSQLEEKNDGKEIVIFHKLTKIRDKKYEVIMDCGSCINTVFSELIENDWLKTLPHSHPFKVPLIKSIVKGVKQSYLVPDDFHLYFWRTVWHMLGIKSKFSTAFQPQIDGQIEIVYRSPVRVFMI